MTFINLHSAISYQKLLLIHQFSLVIVILVLMTDFFFISCNNLQLIYYPPYTSITCSLRWLSFKTLARFITRKLTAKAIHINV